MRSMTVGALAVISFLWSGLPVNSAVKGCAIAQKAPDAFLYLRKAPANSEIVTRLKPGDLLFVDSAICETGGSLSICDNGNPAPMDARDIGSENRQRTCRELKLRNLLYPLMPLPDP